MISFRRSQRLARSFDLARGDPTAPLRWAARRPLPTQSKKWSRPLIFRHINPRIRINWLLKSSLNSIHLKHFCRNPPSQSLQFAIWSLYFVVCVAKLSFPAFRMAKYRYFLKARPNIHIYIYIYIYIYHPNYKEYRTMTYLLCTLPPSLSWSWFAFVLIIMFVCL